MRYLWEIVALAFLGAIVFSFSPKTTFTACQLATESGEETKQYFKLSELRYPWTIFLGHDAILTGGLTPLPSYIELSKVSGVGYIQSDESDAAIILSSLSGEAAFTVQDVVFSGECRRIRAVFP